jgi:hypothetical protein
MGFQEIIDELDQYDLTPEQSRKLAQVRTLAQQRGLIIDPTLTENQKNESISQSPPPAKTFNEMATEFMTHDVPEIGAATAGGIYGASQAARLPLPGLLKPLAIGAGGILGATTGLLGVRGATKSLEQGRPLSLDQLLQEGQRAGLETTAGEALGMGGRILGKGYQLGKQHLLAGRAALPEELKMFQDAKSLGVHLTPADVTMQPSALRTEQTLRGTQAGSDIFRRRGLLNQENFTRVYEHDLLDTVASKVTPQERGQLIKDVLEGRAIPEYQEMARRGFDELRQITGGKKTVMPKESFALAQELAGSVTAETNPKAAGIVKKVMDQLGQPGLVTGMNVAKHIETTPGQEITTGLKVFSKSKIQQPPLTTGLTVKERVGNVSEMDQAIEDVGGPKAEPPLLGLKVKKRSDEPQADIVTGLGVHKRTQPGPETEQLGGLTVTNVSHAPDIPRPLDFMEAHSVRSMLGEMGATGETLPKKAQGIANRLWQVLGLEMEQGAMKFQQQTGIPLSRKWRQADDVVKEQGHALFDANVIAKMLKANPEDVVKETLKKDGLTEVQTVVRALGRIQDEPGLEQYRRGVLEELWNRGVLKAGARREEISGAAFADAASGIGHDVIKAALGPVYPRYQKFLEVAAHMESRSASGMGMSLVDKGLLITAPLAGVGGSIMSGSPYPLIAAAGAMGTWLIGTHHFSRSLNNPQKAEQLLRVMKASPNTQAWTRAVGQFVSIEGNRFINPSSMSMPQLQPAPSTRIPALMNQD